MRPAINKRKNLAFCRKSLDSEESCADPRVSLETRVQINELRMELERKDVALKEAQLGRSSLQNELNSLKGILNEDEDEDDEDEDVRAKETIIARDREISQLKAELESTKERSKSLKEGADR